MGVRAAGKPVEQDVQGTNLRGAPFTDCNEKGAYTHARREIMLHTGASCKEKTEEHPFTFIFIFQKMF